MKRAAFAGQFYSSDSKELEKNIKEMLKDSEKPVKKAFGIICPHAGYAYSGKAAAFSYKAISKQKFDTFVILGTNHSGRGIGISDEDFETPLGIIKTDKEFSQFIYLGKEKPPITLFEFFKIEQGLESNPIQVKKCLYDDIQPENRHFQ